MKLRKYLFGVAFLTMGLIVLAVFLYLFHSLEGKCFSIRSPDGRFTLQGWAQPRAFAMPGDGGCQNASGSFRLVDNQQKLLNSIKTDSLSALAHVEWDQDELYFTFAGDSAGGIDIAKWPLISREPVQPEYRQADLQNRLALASDPKVIKTLLIEGADPNLRDSEGRIIFFSAVSDRNFERVRLFVEHGANLKLRDEFDRTALNRPSNTLGIDAEFTIPALAYLIEKGADVNAQDNKGKTPLHIVNSIDEARYLIEHGADFNMKDKAGNTPLDYLALRKLAYREHVTGDVNYEADLQFLTDIEEYLRSKGALINTIFPGHSKKIPDGEVIPW